MANRIPLSGSIIKEKAKTLAEKIEFNNFKASNGWLNRFIKRNGLSFKKVCGESASVDTNISENYKENVLSKLLEEYDPDDIHNLDELWMIILPVSSG